MEFLMNNNYFLKIDSHFNSFKYIFNMKYFYYRIYKALTKLKTNKTPAFNAMILVVALQGMNIFSVYMLINYFLNLEFENKQTVTMGLSLYIILLIPNYFYLFRKKEKIMRKYQNETKEDRTWGIIGLLLYIIVSITVFFVLGETIRQKLY